MSGAQVAAAVLVPGAVVWALQGAFGSMGRWGVATRVLGRPPAPAGSPWRAPSSRAAGWASSRRSRPTALAAAVCIALFPPRHVPLRAAPRLMFRSLLTTLSFVCILLGVQQGSPVVVQTVVATTPLFVLAVESWRARSRPPARVTAAAALVVAGVALALGG
ncbi:MAG: hypothetical protein R3C32_02290 [Chloroflexota bacterium]